MKKLLLGITLTILLAGCQLVAPYDQITDNGTMSLQSDMDTMFLDMETQAGTPAAQYSNYITQYNSFQARIHSLQVRASILPNNSLTIKELGELQNNLTLLVELHKSEPNGLIAPEVASVQSSFDTNFAAILKLELAKETYRNGTN